MIKPTVGRVVHYYGSKDLIKYQPLAAVVAFVESDEKVNLTVFGHKGECFPRERVRLVQDLEKAKATDNLPDSEFCTWMPFQKAQAEKPPVNEELVMKMLETHNEAILKLVEERFSDLTKKTAEAPPGVTGSSAASVSPSGSPAPVKQVTK